MIAAHRSMGMSVRFSRRSGAALASVGVGKVELLGRGYWHPPAPVNLSRRVVAVGSTGGRVGKSTVAAHLAVAMANLGAQVIAVDMDLRSPSLHALFGVERPALGLQALLDDEIQNLDSSLSRTAVRNLHLLAGGAPGARAGGPAGLNGDQRKLLMHQLGALDGDVVILDLGANTYDDLIDCFSLAATGLLVASPQPRSLVTSFEFLRHAARRAAGATERAPADWPRGFVGRVIGNLATSAEEVEILHAFSRLVHARLGIDLPVAGCVGADNRLAEATALGRSSLVGGRLTESGRVFHVMAETLLRDETRRPAEGTATAPAPVSVHLEEPLTEALLDASLDLHRRKHLRYDVDWTATLHLPVDGRRVAVRIVDISMSGAALEVVSELQLGETATLVFDQLPGRPALPVDVKSLDPSLRRAGVVFTGAEELRHPVVAAAQAQRAART
jgi:MinD-like ATPase involved in chromosome partitioning or flagellar assembly